MTDLLLKEQLRTSNPDAEVRSVARVRTLTVLRGLDGSRKAVILKFLWEAGLVNRGKQVVQLRDASFRGADLREIRFHYSIDRASDDGGKGDDQNVSLRYADLCMANLRGANLIGADLFRSQLAKADLSNIKLGTADLRDADLTDACLQNANLGGANLKRAKLRGAKLSGSNLHGADFQNADFTGTDVRGTDLRYAENLTQEQLDVAVGDETVRIRNGMSMPPAWRLKL